MLIFFNILSLIILVTADDYSYNNQLFNLTQSILKDYKKNIQPSKQVHLSLAASLQQIVDLAALWVVVRLVAGFLPYFDS